MDTSLWCPVGSLEVRKHSRRLSIFTFYLTWNELEIVLIIIMSSQVRKTVNVILYLISSNLSLSVSYFDINVGGTHFGARARLYVGTRTLFQS